MKKPPASSRPAPPARDETAPPFITKPDAPSAPGPEPSLAMRMARADLDDAFETGAPPFDGAARPDVATHPTPARISGQTESRLGQRGGRVDAVGATYGRGDRAGAAAAGIPVQSVGAAMTTPSLEGSSLELTQPDPPVPPERDDAAEAGHD